MESALTVEKTTDVIAYVISHDTRSCDKIFKIKVENHNSGNRKKVNPCRQPRSKVNPRLNKVTRHVCQDSRQITALISKLETKYTKW